MSTFNVAEQACAVDDARADVPRFGASMRLPSTIKEEGVVEMEAAKARKDDAYVAHCSAVNDPDRLAQ